jgi:hypothetical protein
MAREIFRIKFDKHKTPEGINCYRLYTLDMTGEVDGEYLTPQKITVKDGRVKVTFKELGIIHEFSFSDDVELFYRDKVKKDAEQTTDNPQ